MRMRKRTAVLWLVGNLIVTMAWAQGTSSQTEQKSTQAYMDMMRKDLRIQKQSIVDQAMGLEAAQKAQFWSIYDKYQKDLKALWDQRIANIKKYSENWPDTPDAVADQLANKALDLATQRVTLQKKYYGELKAAMGARVASRFLQVETVLEHLIDLQVMSQIPLIQ
jgi:hypothetical protein